ncbi:MAG: oligosaccharide flippase family protein [Bacteroidota bacterium]
MQTGQLFQEFKKTGKLDKPVLHALIFRLIGLGLIFALQIVLARLMGPRNYGDYTVIITALNLLLVVSMFGFDSSILRFLPSSLSKGDAPAANGFVKFSYRMIMVLAIICSLAIFIFLLAKSKKFHIGFSEGLFWAVLLLPFMAFTNQASAVLRSLRMIKLSLLSAYFLFPVLMGIACWYYFSSYNKLPVDAAMLINLGITASICIFINRKAGRVMKEVVGTKDATYKKKLWVSVSSVLFMTTLMDLLLKQSDILMVSYFLGNTKAGIYSVAAKLATLASLGLSVADYVIMPKISALYESKQFIKLQKLIRTASFQILSISLPVIVGMAVFGKLILGFFGKPYADAYGPLLILLVGQLINAGTGMVGGLLTMTGHHRMFFSVYAVAIFIQFVLNSVLIKYFGIIGAAIGSSLGLVFLNITAYMYVRKRLRIKASIF